MSAIDQYLASLTVTLHLSHHWKALLKASVTSVPLNKYDILKVFVPGFSMALTTVSHSDFKAFGLPGVPDTTKAILSHSLLGSLLSSHS